MIHHNTILPVTLFSFSNFFRFLSFLGGQVHGQTPRRYL